MGTTHEAHVAGDGAPYAVFLSYNREDRETVEKVAVYLEDQARLKTWFDSWMLVPGESKLAGIYRGLEASVCCAVFVGKSSRGPWEQQEVSEALHFKVKKGNYRIVPVLLPEATTRPELPDFFNTTWVDLRGGLDDDAAVWRLECGIRGIPPGRGRPSQTPPPEAAPAQTAAPPELITGRIEVPRAERAVSVFVSYRHKEPDQSVARALAEALRGAGHEVFIDTGIRWGANWVREINRYLEKAHYFLLLLSKDSAASEMVIEELVIAKELASKKGAPVILPLRVSLPFDAPLPYHVSAYLRSIQQEQWARPDDTTLIIERLLDVISEKARWAAADACPPADGPPGSAAPSQPSVLNPQTDPRHMITPGGALEASSRFYIMRQADEEVFEHVLRDRGLVTIRGPRQTGKTSLMIATDAALHVEGGSLRPAFVDFQSFSPDDLSSLSCIWLSVANHVARALKLDGWDPQSWKAGTPHDEGFGHFLDRHVFADDERPILICLDEVDRIFLSPIKDGFFGTLRSFYNDGARLPNWRRVRWLLGTSSDPYFFIQDFEQSPFNIGHRVNLDVFTRAETETLARRHGLEPDAALLDRVMAYLGGRPYLVHLFFYHLARRPDSVGQLFDARSAGGGAFRDHLHRYLMHFQRDAALAEAMRRVIRGKFRTGTDPREPRWLTRLVRRFRADDARLADRLEAGGLARHDERNRLVPRCGLYAEFFREEL
jgi:AAA-like domain/TIR domain